MALRHTAGVLLLCVVLCWATDVKVGRNLDQKTDPGGHCILEKEFINDHHYCVLIGEEKCSQGTCVAEGSVCIYRPKTSVHTKKTVYKCTSGEWKLHGHQTSKVRKRRWIFFIPFLILALSGSSSESGGGKPQINKPPVFDNCPNTTITVRAPKGNTSAIATWPTLTASDPEGKGVSVESTNGKKSGDEFPSGETTVKYRATDPGSASDVCVFLVKVEVLRCHLKPRYILHGTYSCSHNNNEDLYGSVCTYNCETGYTIIGTSEANVTIECLQNQQWDFPQGLPTCVPIPCGPPGPIKHGTPTCVNDRYEFDDVCFINCNSGFGLSGKPFIRCTENGTWSLSEGCVDNEAPKFTCPPNMEGLFSDPLGAPVSVNWTDPVVTDNSNYTLTSTTAKGSLLGPGIHIIRITATDDVGYSKSCNFIVSIQARECEEPKSANGRYTCTHRYVEGSQCLLTCNPGYTPQGPSTTLTCLKNETWDHAAPVCEVVNCGNPPVVESGTFSGASFQYPAILNLECDLTFTLQGGNFVECQENGLWSQAGECIDTTPPTFPAGCPSDVEVYASRLGHPTVAHWTPPRADDNSGKPVTLQSSIAPGSVFSPGMTTVTYTATDQRGQSSDCDFYVTVNTLMCISLTQNYTSNNYLRYTCPDKNVYGAVCTTYCTNGFPKTGADNLTCELDSSIAYPPTVSWQWDPSSTHPQCIESACANLTAPKNGALACFTGSLSKECVVSCEETHDVSVIFDGHLKCPHSKGIWYPSTVPDCVNIYLPGQIRMMSSVYYYTNSCSNSLEEIKQNFLTAITNIYPDACADLPDICVTSNIQVTCRASRRKKSILPAFQRCLKRNRGKFWRCKSRQKRSAANTHYIKVTFSLKANCDDGVMKREEAYQKCSAMELNVTTFLKSKADGGELNLAIVGTSYTTSGSLMVVALRADCDPGTLFERSVGTTTLACVGCSKGNFVAINSTQCEECPVGTYTELDIASACTPCPQGWSTATTGSSSSSDCQEMCKPGHYSEDGFSPCQPCPPGQYQALSRATSCDLCPASTWSTGAASGLEQCISADAHLSNNTSLIAKSSNSVSALTFISHLLLADITVSNVTFNFVGNSYNPVSVHLYTHSSLASYVPVNSSESVSLHAEPNVWLKLVMTADPTNGSINIEFGSSSVLTRTTTPTASLPPTDVVVTATEGKVLVSGLFGKDDLNAVTPSQTNIDCNGDSSTNLMTWFPPSTSPHFPSICDAVDECLSSPCSIHGECVNQQGSFLCECQDGWSGSTCHLPPDACYLHQCRNGATCLPQESNYSCDCTETFSGIHCQLIKVNGGFSDWSVWSSCSSSCHGQQSRHRVCNNPAPNNGGDNCTGDFQQVQSCGPTSCPVDGQWSTWDQWSACSATCGTGTFKTRRRVCNNPAPQFGGDPCEGDSKETFDCATNKCAVDGKWSEWSPWSECSKSCGGGNRMRSRTCSAPAPQFHGHPCNGFSLTAESCETDICPVCSSLRQSLQPSSTILLDCNDNIYPLPDPVICNVTCATGFVPNQPFPQYKCGPSSGYLWNDQVDRNSSIILPECTVAKKAGSVEIKTCHSLQGSCQTADVISVNSVKPLPCEAEGCKINTSAECSNGCNSQSSRKKRSTGILTLSTHMRMELGESTDFNISDMSTEQQYTNKLMVADQSAAMLVGNQTSSFLTVSHNGKTIEPDETSVVYSTSMQCPPGTTNSSFYCVNCSKGSMEASGQCILCPVGQYQDQPGSTTCKSCPVGYAWDLIGAKDISQCIYPMEVIPVPKENPHEGDVQDNVDTALIAGATVCAAAVLIILAFVFAMIHLRPKLQTKYKNYRRRSTEVFPSTEESRPASPIILDMWVRAPLEKQIPVAGTRLTNL